MVDVPPLAVGGEEEPACAEVAECLEPLADEVLLGREAVGVVL